MDALGLIRSAEHALRDVYAQYEDIAFRNQAKVLKAFQNRKVRESYFAPSSGYGYGDQGRDELESIYAQVMDTEEAMVRSQIVSGTHAISACLAALLQPGQQMLAVAGTPYDTLTRVIGKDEPGPGTLIARGIKYDEVALDSSGRPDYQAIAARVNADTRVALIQRSRGYSLRPSLRVGDIAELIGIIRAANSATIIFVDNCYGEFTDTQEPSSAGADLMAGSLIKNPGGGLAPAGGYIAGCRELVEEVAYHLTAPGLGKALGASLSDKRNLYQGFFLAPHTVLQAMKGSLLLAYVFRELGYEVFPGPDEPRGDIVQAVRLGSAEQVIRFCQTVQNSSPVDSDVRLEYGAVPGYQDRIVMAAGTFVQGSSIEISCDAPLREPYVAYWQGGLCYEHCRLAVQNLAEAFSR
ncbi:MAG: methionine gamma-lyase family protein [Syntrophomonadaceae bacterium]